MVLTGKPLLCVLIFLVAWLVLSVWAVMKSIKQLAAKQNTSPRFKASLAGAVLSLAAVASLVLLHLSWLTPNVSHTLGSSFIRGVGFALLWSSLAGFVLGLVGSGRIRFIGLIGCLITGLWYLTLSMEAAIAMGASPQVRHPIRMEIPDGYVGWVEVDFGMSEAAKLPVVDGHLLCVIPKQGVLRTSDLVEDGWASDEYFYYLPSGSKRPLRETGWGEGGLVWGQETSSKNGNLKQLIQYTYIGTETQFKRGVNNGPVRYP